MATVNAEGNLVIDGDTQEGSALLLDGLETGRTIRVEIVGLTPMPPPEEGYSSIYVGKYTDYGWNYYDEEEIMYGAAPVDFILEAGENLVVFSYHKSFLFEISIRYHVDSPEVTNIYEQPAIVPAAVSSQLDITGEERIHIAPWIEVPPPPPEICAEAYLQGTYYGSEIFVLPDWVVLEDYGDSVSIVFSDVGYEEYQPEANWRIVVSAFMEDGQIYVLGDFVDGSPPYGPYDGEPTVVQGFAYSFLDSDVQDQDCAIILLQEQTPE